MASPSSSSSDKSPYTNMIYNSFKVEAKYMKTSHSRAWECKPLPLEFIVLLDIENMFMKVNIHT